VVDNRARPTRPAPPTLKAVVVRSCGVALFLVACGIANTPQQDLAYARWAKCNSTSATLERVDLDGQITFRYTTAGDREEIVQCFAEAGRTGQPLLSASPGARCRTTAHCMSSARGLDWSAIHPIFRVRRES
jgi:hypothetical protein